MSSDGIKLVVQAEKEAVNKVESAKKMALAVIEKARMDAEDQAKILEIDLKTELELRRAEQIKYLERLRETLEIDLNKKLKHLDSRNIDKIVEAVVKAVAEKEL